MQKIKEKRFYVSTFICNALVCCMLLLATGCSEEKKKEATNSQTKVSLKDAFEDYFYIGAALNESQIFERDSLDTELLHKEFNSITPENNLKWMFLEPEKGKFEFETADRFVDLGTRNEMFVIGHTLVWHSQLAEWVSNIENTKELSNSLKNHIQTIVSRYQGKIDGWDVVNEALNEDGSLRKSLFLEKLGEQYLIDSFKWAEEADPNVELYYNDYNMCNPEKRAGAIELVKLLKENGAKIDGVGMQGHWNLESPSLEEIETSIKAYSELGVKVMITELDITVLPNPWDLEGAEVSQNFENSEKMNPYPNGLPDSVSIKLAKRYQDIFKLFKKHQDKISRVTFWGINDGQSWLNGWPIRGRTNYPLLFDRNNQPKAAYDRIINVAKDTVLY